MYRATLGRWLAGRITFKVTAKGLQRMADLPIRWVERLSARGLQPAWAGQLAALQASQRLPPARAAGAAAAHAPHPLTLCTPQPTPPCRRDIWVSLLFFLASLVCLIFGLVHFFRGPLDTPLAISLLFMLYNLVPQYLLLQVLPSIL